MNEAFGYLMSNLYHYFNIFLSLLIDVHFHANYLQRTIIFLIVMIIFKIAQFTTLKIILFFSK